MARALRIESVVGVLVRVSRVHGAGTANSVKMGTSAIATTTAQSYMLPKHCSSAATHRNFLGTLGLTANRREAPDGLWWRRSTVRRICTLQGPPLSKFLISCHPRQAKQRRVCNNHSYISSMQDIQKVGSLNRSSSQKFIALTQIQQETKFIIRTDSIPLSKDPKVRVADTPIQVCKYNAALFQTFLSRRQSFQRAAPCVVLCAYSYVQADILLLM
jgi:hypothetical protein